MTGNGAISSPPPWQLELARGFRDPARMLEALGLPNSPLPYSPLLYSPGQSSETKPASFPFRVPRGYVARMERGNPHDPLLRQVLPVADEALASPGYQDDPLNERGALRAPGILHKYSGRALLVATGACAIHCRYCFRRHFSCGDAGAGLGWIERNDTIREVILSGGDPLCLSDGKLAALTEALADIPHVRRLRIHTRLPVALPERVDDGLLGWLTGTALETVVVIHANHPNEIDGGVEKALLRFRREGVIVLNQSVLLRGVNDHEDTLAGLSERLFSAGTLPYYLHMLDPVAGSRHFAVGVGRAREIMRKLRARLPGYLAPRLVREVAGKEYKIPL